MMAGDNRPSYYRSQDGKLTAIEVIDAFGLDFREGSILKYLVRWRKKDGLADLRKIRTYAQMIIDHEQVLADAVVDATIWCDGEIGAGCVNGPADHEFNATCRPLDEWTRDTLAASGFPLQPAEEVQAAGEKLQAPELSPVWANRAARREAVRKAVETVFQRVSAGQRDRLTEVLLQQLGEMQVRRPGQE